MNKEVLEALVRKWRADADATDGWCSNENRYFSYLSEDEKNHWRYSQAKATGLRTCANDLDNMLRGQK